MHERAVKLLRAASDLAGGDEALARRLRIDPALLSTLMSGQHELPESVLLATVDILLAGQESAPSGPGEAAQPGNKSDG